VGACSEEDLVDPASLKCNPFMVLASNGKNARFATELATRLQFFRTSDEPQSEVEDDMELQKKIRMQLMMAGFGAALLMAGSARAQQDMDPTYFDINPGTPAISKAAPVRVAQSAPAATQSGSTQSALRLAVSREATLEAGMARMAILDAGIALILLGGIGSIVLYAMVATRRERNLGASSVNAPYHPVSAATAQ
jgi:hypothetical protein